MDEIKHKLSSQLFVLSEMSGKDVKSIFVNDNI